MNRRSWRFVLIVAVAAFTLSLAAPQADAQWWGWYRPVGCCGWSCYSPCYATVGCNSRCDSGLYLGWRPGPVRRLLFGPYRWYRGWYGCGCGCGYDCGWDCGCSTCETCCSNTTSTWPSSAPLNGNYVPTPAKRPAEPPAAMPPESTTPTSPAPSAPSASPVLPKTSATSADASGILTVWVPYNAKVTINGRETRSTGSRREFVSYGLTPGLSYKYVVHAEVVRNGQTLEDTQTVTLTAGQIEAVAFGFNTAPTEQVASR